MILNPKKIKWYLGASSLAMLFEQDRQHWLMKTDRIKQTQDTKTGDIFQSQIDNLGSDIIIETEKFGVSDIVTKNGEVFPSFTDVFTIEKSVFPYTPMLNGLHFLRIKSINIEHGSVTYNNFRMILHDVEPVFIPMAPDANDPDEFVYKWYRTTSQPVFELSDGTPAPSTEIFEYFGFQSGVSNPVYYFPADEVLQPISATITGDGTLTTDFITSDDMIGMPMLWFTCTESNIGPSIQLDNNKIFSPTGDALLLSIGHNGAAPDTQCQLFPVTSSADSATPNCGPTSDWNIKCTSDEFTGDITDGRKPITSVVFQLKSDLPDNKRTVTISNVRGNNIVTLNMNLEWTYDSENKTYTIALDTFDSNLYGESYPLIHAFNVVLDSGISFDITTTDKGYVGIQMGSSKNYDPHFPRYPHDITNLQGLPDWLQDRTSGRSPQHMSLYALHDTPFYDPEDQLTRQIAGLIMDPGIERTHSTTSIVGRYRIKSVTIVDGGSGYSWQGMLNDVWIVFPSGVRSTARLAITGVDQNGSVTDIEVVYDTATKEPDTAIRYPNPGSLVSIIDPRIENPGSDPLHYADGIREVVPDEVLQQLWFVGNVDDHGRCLLLQNEWKTSSLNRRIDIEYLINYDRIIAPSEINEPSWDPSEFIGQELVTHWQTWDDYSEDCLLNIRSIDDGNMHPMEDYIEYGGHAGDIDPWVTYTSASGVGLIVRITPEDIEEISPPVTPDDVPTEEIGRVYVVSNDDIHYINNATAKNPKPARTVARICDIPTSVMQLSNISGVSPTSVVDKKYVRSESSYRGIDQDYLYNGSRNLWVRPVDKDVRGIPIYNPEDPEHSNSNKYVFDSWDMLNKVDLMVQNDYRKIENLNQGVSPDDVSISSITERGTGYHIGDKGIIVVGGFSFTYEITDATMSGQVLDLLIGSNDQTDTVINLANFNMPEEMSSGITLEYGTSPIASSSGRGLKVTLQIANMDRYLPKKGDVRDDLYAFIRDTGGIWIATYLNNQWVKGITSPIAQSSDSDVIINEGNVSYRDAYMRAILPTAHNFNICVNDTAHNSQISVLGLQTASSINIIDQNVTPVYVPQISDDPNIPSQNVSPLDNKQIVDINRLWLSKSIVDIAPVKNESGVYAKLKELGYDWFDSYIFWKWNESSGSSRTFTCYIVTRSLNNLMSSDTTTILPSNELISQHYVHTNAQTTVMWNVPHVGPMVWMFDPQSNIHEKYYVNAHTRDLYVVRKNHSIYDLGIPNLTDGRGNLNYNIMTNSPIYAGSSDLQSPIYQQPGFKSIASVGTPMAVLDIKFYGTWRLVFPSLTDSYKLSDTVSTGIEYTPVKMQILRGVDIGTTGDVINDEGMPVNYKTILMNENVTTGRVELKVYDQETHQWIVI